MNRQYYCIDKKYNKRRVAQSSGVYAMGLETEIQKICGKSAVKNIKSMDNLKKIKKFLTNMFCWIKV